MAKSKSPKNARSASKPPAKPKKDRWKVKTLSDVGIFFGGLSRAAITNWVGAGMPSEKGAYDLSAIAQWRLARAQRRSTAGGAEAADGSTSQALQKLHEENLREQVRYRRAKRRAADRKLLPRRQVELAIAELVLMIIHRIEAWPDQVEPSLPAETRIENKRDLQQAVRLLRTELSQWKLPPELMQ